MLFSRKKFANLMQAHYLHELTREHILLWSLNWSVLLLSKSIFFAMFNFDSKITKWRSSN